jgi:hypothetical protein
VASHGNPRAKLRLFGFISAILILAFAAWRYWNREPRYQGVPASAYVLGLIDPNSMSRKSPLEEIRRMGSDLAVPALIRVIETQDSDLVRWYRTVHSKIPINMRKPLPVPRDPDRIIATAFFLLGELGPQSSSAVPALISLHRRHPRQTISALGAIGPAASNAVPMLIHGVHPSSLNCFTTVSALWRIDPNGNMTASALSRLPADGRIRTALREFTLQVRDQSKPPAGTPSAWDVCKLLALLRPEAEHAVPALTALLANENERVRAKAAEILGTFGAAALPSVNNLEGLCLDDWQMVREAATNALRVIKADHP